MGDRGAVSRTLSAARARRWWTSSHRCLYPLDSATPPLKALLTVVFRRNATLPRTLSRAFARPGEVSAELREAIGQSVSQIPSLVDTVLGPVTDAAIPCCPVLILWGEEDRLNRGDQIIKWILQRTQARVERIPAAGHVPQIEQPREFIQHLLAFAVGTV